MTPAEFWVELDAALRALDRAGIPAMGPDDLRGGLEDCISCSLAALEADGVDTDGPFVFYHDQDRNPARAECRLAWNGEQTPLRLATELARRGLTCELPADETVQIRVFPA